MQLCAHEDEAERCGYRLVAGLDEAGRAPLAGPVVAAAVVLPRGFAHAEINDSKQLTPALRDRLYGEIYAAAITVGIGIVDAVEIDRINILRASLRAMAIAAENLRPPPDYLLIDGPYPAPVDWPQKPIIDGDCLSISIAAASIVAKVTRDRLMNGYDMYYPVFGFARHKGYPTKCHREAIRSFGCCPIHRRTFRSVREHLPTSPGALFDAQPAPAVR
jgi:ribonuclease HII